MTTKARKEKSPPRARNTSTSRGRVDASSIFPRSTIDLTSSRRRRRRPARARRHRQRPLPVLGQRRSAATSAAAGFDICRYRILGWRT
nr:unnamed protein product [Digitaria exilis]